MARPTKGLEAFFADLDKLEAKVRNKAIRKGHRAGAKLLAGEVKAESPVESGRTKRSVRVRAGKRKKNLIITNVEITGDHDEPMIGFVEFGTKDQEADPFIRRSVAKKRDEVIDTIADEVSKEIAS